jgi:S-adenosylmethionine hydrolase
LAPAAALLSLGWAPRRLGSPCKPKGASSFWAKDRGSAGIEGKVIDVDRFGNLITNIRASQLNQKKKVRIHYRKWRLASLEKTYGLRKRSQPIALIGSGGVLELALPQGNAERSLKGSVGEKVAVTYG